MKDKFLKHRIAYLLGVAVVSAWALPVVAQEMTDHSAMTGSSSDIWPSLHEILEYTDQQPLKAETSLTAPRDHIFTEEELEALFQGAPFTFHSGSLFLDDLNGLSGLDISSQDGVQVRLANGKAITRPSWRVLQEEITDRLCAYQGDWSVYIKDLASGNTMEINEHSMESASLIKLYIAGTIYEQFDLGNLSETDEIMNALNLMITVSDNESSNVLVRKLYGEGESFQDGLDVVNDFIARHGFQNTKQVNGIADPSLWVSGEINKTSPADCGKLLEDIYDRDLVSHFNSYRFETLLNKQEVNYKIPAALPEGVHISHKTGEVDDTENDAAIIYTPYGDYIFCIMSTNLTDTDAAVEHIHEITRLVYDYFTTDASDTASIQSVSADNNSETTAETTGASWEEEY